uniref:Uncharacterized protein n=1 Tax=Arundo donax TaxID=35708 RepID=A0A0A8ZEI5_ARUDO
MRRRKVERRLCLSMRSKPRRNWRLRGSKVVGVQYHEGRKKCS